MITCFVHRDGRTSRVDDIDPGWLAPDSKVRIWADVQQPTPDDGRILRDLFGIHPLAVEDALGQTDFPKVEIYDGILYVVLHGCTITLCGSRTRRSSSRIV